MRRDDIAKCKGGKGKQSRRSRGRARFYARHGPTADVTLDTYIAWTNPIVVIGPEFRRGICAQFVPMVIAAGDLSGFPDFIISNLRVINAG